nr:ATP-binding protein [uncultured Desulfobacter sp.]
MLQPVRFYHSIVTRLSCLAFLIFMVFAGILMLNYYLAWQTEKRVAGLVEKDIPGLIKNQKLNNNLSRLYDDIKIMLINFTGEDYTLAPETQRLLTIARALATSSPDNSELTAGIKDLLTCIEDLFDHCMAMDDSRRRMLVEEKRFMDGMDALEISTTNLILENKRQGTDYELASLEQISALIPNIWNLVLRIKLQVSDAERAYFTGKKKNQAYQENIQSMLTDIKSNLALVTTAGDALRTIGEQLISQIQDYNEKTMSFYRQMKVLENKILFLGTRQSAVNEIMAKMGNRIEKKTETMQNRVIKALQTLGTIMLTLSLLVVALLIIVTIVGARIAGPIRELIACALEIAAGNLDTTIQINGRDEVGILSCSLAGMRDALKNKIDDLAAKNRELSRQIEERKKIEGALLKSENKYRTLVENLPQKILHKDTESVYISANESYCRDLKIHPDNIPGKTDHDFFPKKIAEKYISDDKRIMASEKIEELEETYILDGRECTVNTVKVPIKNHAGEVMGILIIFWDITRTKQLEAQLAQSHKMEAIGTLAGGIAHDFNNILGAIMGYTQLALLDAPEHGKYNSNLCQVMKAAGRAKDLVVRILTFSRRGNEQQEPIRIGPVLDEALKMIRPSIPSTIEIQKEIGEESGFVMAGATQIHQVLINLCINASHAMKKKGGVLRVGLEEVELSDEMMKQHPLLKSKSCVKIAVGDTGSGIPEKELGRIFEPYYTTKGKGVGIGLGLAVVHGIIQSHGGAVEVISRPGKGTVFHIYFPRTQSAPQEDRTIPEDKNLLQGKGRILLVDDEQSLLEMGAEMLRRMGYGVVPENRPINALAIFQAAPQAFDLVITDQTMPKMTGHELALALMKIRPDLPVVLCSGYSELIDEKKAKELGIREFIIKPFTMDRLSEMTLKALGGI